MTSLAERPAGVPVEHRRVLAPLLRLELRRSAMLWMLPLLAVLLSFTEFRNWFSQAPMWALRSTDMQDLMEPTGAIVAGVAAWMASRDARRDIADLMATTARPRWARQLFTWAAVTAWAVLFYAACLALVFGVTARQTSWGGPIWWMPGVGAAAIVACSAAGFAFGAFFPSRFAAPLVAIGAALAPQVGVVALQQHHPWGRVSPVEDPTVPATGIFFPFHTGLSIVQIMFLAGVSAVALGVLALPAAAGGRWLRRAGAAIAVAGLAAACAGAALADTTRESAQGIIVPALHNAASDRVIAYTPVCEDISGIAVCLHPAYRPILGTVTAAVGPVLRQVAGLPGAPVRVSQLGTLDPLDFGTERGNPPVLYLPPIFPLPGQVDPAEFTQYVQQSTAYEVTGANLSKRPYAQLVVGQALVIIAEGQQQAAGPQAAPRSTRAELDHAAQRFAALPASVRRAWLAAHLTALREGQITPRELP
jgi:hypothetical protein